MQKWCSCNLKWSRKSWKCFAFLFILFLCNLAALRVTLDRCRGDGLTQIVGSGVRAPLKMKPLFLELSLLILKNPPTPLSAPPPSPYKLSPHPPRHSPQYSFTSCDSVITNMVNVHISIFIITMIDYHWFILLIIVTITIR